MSSKSPIKVKVTTDSQSHSNGNGHRAPSSSLKLTTRKQQNVIVSILKALGALGVAVFAGVIALCLFADWVGPRFHAFDRHLLHKTVLEVLPRQVPVYHPHIDSTEVNSTVLVGDIIQAVKKAFPDVRIKDDYLNEAEWMFNNAGGVMGSMFMMHGSITEYLLIFGSAVGTEGHTGRHTADDYFHILKGEQWAQRAGQLTREVYRPGDMHHLRRGTTKQYTLQGETWALEYAVGVIPFMVPFGLADIFTSTLDWGCLYDTVRITGREMAMNLLHGKI